MEIGKETHFYKGLVGYGVKITKDINLMLDCNLILTKQLQKTYKHDYYKTMTENSIFALNLQSYPLLRLENFPPLQNAAIIPQMKEEEQQNDSARLCNEESVAEPNSSQLKREWTPEEDELVYKLHNQYGNKWAIIAEHLKGRTDNCIKNHFYSRLRKGLRKINKLIEDSNSKQYKEFKIIDLYKVIEASDQKFKQFNSSPNKMTDFGHDLKNRIFIFAEEESDGTQQYEVGTKKLLDDMHNFTKNYKRKSKKSRRYSPMGVGSVYRNNSKKQPQLTEAGEPLDEKPEKQPQQIVKIQPIVKIEQELQKKQKKAKPKKQSSKPQPELKCEITLLPAKKQAPKQVTLPQLFNTFQQPPLNRHKSRNTYRKFSDDEGEQKDQAEYLKEQRLNHFAQNILKTFKSYYSFQSFKSNPMMDDSMFQ